MKKIKTLLLLFLVIIMVIIIAFLIKNLFKKNDTTSNGKVISEIKYMDNQLTRLLNYANNINLENYKITVIKTSTDSNSEYQEEDTQSSGSENESMTRKFEQF